MAPRPAAVAALAALASMLVLQGATASSNMECIACTIIMGLLMEKPAVTTDTLAASVADVPSLCGADEACRAFATEHGRAIAAAHADGSSPDQVCQSLKMCDGTCTLFKKWPVPAPAPAPPPLTPPHMPPDDDDAAAPAAAASAGATGTGAPLEGEALLASVAARAMGILASGEAAEAYAAGEKQDFYGVVETTMLVLRKASLQAQGYAAPPRRVGGSPDPCGWNITCIVHRVFDQHLPLWDEDNDLFVPSSGSPKDPDNGFRGADWRGRDCNDSDASIYPGRHTTAHGPEVDHNCNGITGTDPASGRTYEEMWCDGTDQRGLVILGDSAAAHFHIPPSYLRHQKWSLHGLVPMAEDEADWPQCSWATGWTNASACPPSALPLDSFYMRLRNHNRCAHRDFANIGVNGARTGAMAPNNGSGIIEGLRRDQDNDTPMIVFFALIGNDVCNGHPGTSHMTPPDEFYSNVRASLGYLDTVLPAGSSVIFIPLVDGRILWDTLHNDTHPLGIPYADMYDYLDCFNTNPCAGWLTSNATMRNVTTAWAQSLNAEYSKIMSEGQPYKHFQMYFENLSWEQFIDQWAQEGGHVKDLLEPVDGFHPSQTGHMWMAHNVVKILKEKHPEILGKPNPNNAAIIAKFGDQGGYN